MRNKATKKTKMHKKHSNTPNTYLHTHTHPRKKNLIMNYDYDDYVRNLHKHTLFQRLIHVN